MDKLLSQANKIEKQNTRRLDSNLFVFQFCYHLTKPNKNWILTYTYNSAATPA